MIFSGPVNKIQAHNLTKQPDTGNCLAFGQNPTIEKAGKIMTEESRTSLKGEFLIAMPGLGDPNFSHTVVCICEHTADGSIGLVINRIEPSLTAGILFEELNLEYTEKTAVLPVYYGGPVHENEVFILHGPPFHWEGCLMVTPSLALSNTLDVLEAIAGGYGPELFLITIGCAGWGADQIESEILENVWLSCPVSENILFGMPVDERWTAAVREIGINPLLLSDEAGHA